jgi:hypothetical protein
MIFPNMIGKIDHRRSITKYEKGPQLRSRGDGCQISTGRAVDQGDDKLPAEGDRIA